MSDFLNSLFRGSQTEGPHFQKFEDPKGFVRTNKKKQNLRYLKGSYLREKNSIKLIKITYVILRDRF